MNDSQERGLIYGLIPFYYDKSQPDVSKHVEYLKNTIAGLRRAGVTQVIVVDDGSGIPLEMSDLNCDEVITLEKNNGKTGSVVAGINEILKKSPDNLGYIVQCDYDADQNPEDAELLMRKFENASPTENPSLVIGDRYKIAQPDPLEYRRAILHLQELLCKNIGYDIQDTVSGLRAYTKEFAQKFQEMHKSKGFGSDIEQLVIARLLDMKVESIPLTFSRRRSNITPEYKLKEVMDGILVHKTELADKNLGNIVSVISELYENLKAGREFSLDLSPLGERDHIRFLRLGNGYTANIEKNTEINKPFGLH